MRGRVGNTLKLFFSNLENELVCLFTGSIEEAAFLAEAEISGCKTQRRSTINRTTFMKVEGRDGV